MMTELTDLEICKRIGEIEKLNGDFGAHRGGAYGRRYINDSFTPYNPITDDALCFQLGFKYHVSIHYASGKVFISDSDKGSFTVGFDINCLKSLKKAILLCIIEAHKES